MPAGTFTAQPDPFVQQVHSVHRPLLYEIEKQADVSGIPVVISQARIKITYNGSILQNGITGKDIELIVDDIEDIGSDTYKFRFSPAQVLRDQLDPTSLRDLPAIFRDLSSFSNAIETKSYALVSVSVNYYYYDSSSGSLVLKLATGEEDTSDTCMVANFIEQTLQQRGLAGPTTIWAQEALNEYLLINEHVDASGNDIAGRTLTASQKAYILNRLIDTLAPRFYGSSASLFTRTPTEMAKAILYAELEVKTATSMFLWLSASPPFSLYNCIIIYDNQIETPPAPNQFPNVIPVSEMLWVSAINSPTPFGSSFNFVFANVFGVPKNRFASPMWNYTGGTMEFISMGGWRGLLPTLPNFTSLNFGNAIPFRASELEGWLDDDTILRAVEGINIQKNLFTEAKLKEMIDIVYPNRFNLVAGSTFNFSDNIVGGVNQSTLVANDPVYGGTGGLLEQIAIDGNVTVSI